MEKGNAFFSNPALSGNVTENSIEDAVYAVRPIVHPTLPPMLRLNNTRFAGNFIGLFGTAKTFASLQPGQGYNLSEFDGNTFEGRTNAGALGANTAQPTDNPAFCALVTTDQGPEFPFTLGRPAYCGVLMKLVHFVVPAGTGVNTFQNLSAGIVTRAGVTNVSRCKFKDIQRFAWGDDNLPPNYQNYGFGVQGIDANGTQNRQYTVTGLGKTNAILTFDNVESAIYFGSHKENMLADVTQCNMNKVQKGVTLISPNTVTYDPISNTNLVSIGNISTANVLNNTIKANAYFGDLNPAQVADFAGAYGIYIGDQYGTPSGSPITGFSTYHIEQNNITIDMASRCYTPPGAPADPECNDIGNFVGRAFGIEVIGNTPGSLAEMDCRIENNNNVTVLRGDAAIDVKWAHNATIYGNTISLNNGNSVQGSLNYDPFVPNVRGIQVEGGLAHQVRCNTITTNQTNGVVHYGINAETKYNYNTVNGGDQGLAFRGACNNSDIWGNRFISTATKPMNVSLQYNVNGSAANVATVGVQLNRWNRWQGTFGGGTTATGIGYDPTSPIGPNNWTVRTQITGTLRLAPPNCGNILPINLFDCVGTSGTYGCEPPPIQGLTTSITSMDRTISQPNNLGSGAQWLSNRYLYQKLLRDPNLTQGEPAIGSFKTNQSGLSAGTLAEVELLMGGLMNWPTAAAASVVSLNGSIDTKNIQLATAIAQLSADPTNTALQQQADQLQTDIDGLTKNVEDARNLVNSNRAAAAISLKSVNDGVVPSQVYEQNMRTVQAIALKLIAQIPLSTTEMATLLQLANTCFSDGGPATIKARALYASLTGRIITPPACAGAALRPVEDRGNTPSLSMWVVPNPADETVTVNIGAVHGTANLAVIDLLGHVLAQYPIGQDQTDIRVDTGTYPVGIYHLVLSGKGISTNTVKLSVIH